MRGTLEEEKIKIWEDAVELSKRIKGVLTMDFQNSCKKWEIQPEIEKEINNLEKEAKEEYKKNEFSKKFNSIKAKQQKILNKEKIGIYKTDSLTSYQRRNNE